jgi:hypothetical protein
MLPLICNYAVANAKDIKCAQNLTEKQWTLGLNFFDYVCTAGVEMNGFYSTFTVHINGELKFKITERVNFFAENEDLLLERVKSLHLFAVNLQSSFRDFQNVTVAQFGERK